jgi:hypothetical protein
MLRKSPTRFEGKHFKTNARCVGGVKLHRVNMSNKYICRSFPVLKKFCREYFSHVLHYVHMYVCKFKSSNLGIDWAVAHVSI